MAERMTAAEVEMRQLVRRFDEHHVITDRLHREQTDISNRLDTRIDKMELRWAQLVAILSLVILVANAVGPVIASKWLGIP
jgi:hypothetical protein